MGVTQKLKVELPHDSVIPLFFLKSGFKIQGYIYQFWGGLGRERKREREKHQCERETSTGYLLYVPQLGTAPAT